MASLNPVTRELVFKVVFCGPGLGGKTTTLEKLHENAPPEARGQLVSLATSSDRTLYFDFLPLRFGKVRGMHVRLQLFTVPGQVHYAGTRKLVLTGSDGVVFVADAQASRADANQESLEDLEASLAELGRSLATTPHVMQWNKADLPALTALQDLEARFNRHRAPSVRTVASRGDGVSEVLEAIARATIDSYLATVPSQPVPRVELSREGSGIASALRDLTEGRSAPPSTERDEMHTASGRPLSASAASVELERAPSRVPPTARTAVALARSPVSEAKPASEVHLSSNERFSLAEAFPEAERTDVRGIEDLVVRGDTRGAVLASDVLVGRALAPLSPDRSTAWLLAGLDAGTFRAFRAALEQAKAGGPVSREEALACFVWAASVTLAVRGSRGT